MVATQASLRSTDGGDEGHEIIRLLERALQAVDEYELPPYVGARLDEVISTVRVEIDSRRRKVMKSRPDEILANDDTLSTATLDRRPLI